ncbi:MAG: MNIO family bufferin maturase [Alphaproteobacteria bacterium]
MFQTMPPASSEKRVDARIPDRAGVGLKAEHYSDILNLRPDLGWFEVHPENYMGSGGPPHHFLESIREHYPLSLHGVGLSIGGEGALNQDHLGRLKDLNERYQPGLFSEHLAWSSHETHFLNDLLPVPYTEQTLARVVEHIDEVQQVIGRQMLLENPSLYVAFDQSSMSEIEFLTRITDQTGCGLLLDVNNVYVSATNQQYDPQKYIAQFPLHIVGEIHLGGHAPDKDETGAPLLIDAHDRAVDEAVWALYERTIVLGGPRPTLIEWDNDVPDFATLLDQAKQAELIMERNPLLGRRHG